MSKIGDTITLQKQNVIVEACDNCQHLMVNINANEIQKGDMLILKRLGVRISNPETPEKICVNCEVKIKPTFREKISAWFDSDDDDDSSLHSSSGNFGGSSSSDGSGGFGGFGGFGGGTFSGGGATGSF